MPQLKT